MDDLFADMVAALREGQRAMDRDVRLRLEAQPPDWSMLMRLRDVANDYAERGRRLRQMMTDSDADDRALAEVDQLCTFFNGTADLIAQGTGDAEVAAPRSLEDGAGQG